VLINPANASSAEYNFRQVQQAAPSFGMKIEQVLKASTVAEIDAVFATLERERPDALFVAGDGFFDNPPLECSRFTNQAIERRRRVEKVSWPDFTAVQNRPI
jgi:hypothetical protein